MVRSGSDRPAHQIPPPHLPRVEVRHEPDPVCPGRGGRSLRKRGEDITEVLEYVPASFRALMIPVMVERVAEPRR